MPPTVSDSGSRGAGSLFTGVPFAGGSPVSSIGNTSPTPVTKSGKEPPGAPLEVGTSSPLDPTKIPGAAGCTSSE